MEAPRNDKQLLIVAGIVGLVVGGLAGIGGGILVSSGRFGSFARYLPTVNVPRSERDTTARLRVEEESATIDVVRSSSPSVVSVIVRKDVRSIPRGNSLDFGDFFEFGLPFVPSIPRTLPDGAAGDSDAQQVVGGGSGFIVTSDGYILTNRHVVDDGDASFSVVLEDDRELSATVVDRDPLHDLAVLKVDAGAPLPVLPLGDSDTLQIGETVIAIGNALSEYRNTVTKGVISGVNRQVVAGDGFGSSEVIHEAIQTDAAINPGNSGGPLLNLSGTVVGVNTAVSREGQLVGFAIPINIAKQAIDSVIQSGRIVRPWLGVRYLMVTPHLAEQQKLPVTAGALIVSGATKNDLAVVPESPAAKAGLRKDDIITKIDGTAVDTTHPLVTQIARHAAGDRVVLMVLRDGKEREFDVELGEFPDE